MSPEAGKRPQETTDKAARASCVAHNETDVTRDVDFKARPDSKRWEGRQKIIEFPQSKPAKTASPLRLQGRPFYKESHSPTLLEPLRSTSQEPSALIGHPEEATTN